MKVRYITPGNVYLLTNFAASNNPLFLDEEDVENFKFRLEKHLKGIAKVLGFAFHNDHYQILVALEERSKFIEFYRKKHNGKLWEEDEIPLSTYILSQEMANIQSGYAKWFNYRRGRYGVVFGRRYTKVLVKDDDELQEWLDVMHSYRRFWSFEEFWSYVWNFLRRLDGLTEIANCSVKWYEENYPSGFNEGFITTAAELKLLRGQYIAKLPFT